MLIVEYLNLKKKRVCKEAIIFWFRILPQYFKARGHRKSLSKLFQVLNHKFNP